MKNKLIKEGYVKFNSFSEYQLLDIIFINDMLENVFLSSSDYYRKQIKKIIEEVPEVYIYVKVEEKQEDLNLEEKIYTYNILFITEKYILDILKNYRKDKKIEIRTKIEENLIKLEDIFR